MTKRTSLYLELKRRNVLRSATLYIGVAWALAQGVSQLAPSLDLPAWAPRAFLIACAIGFPFWVAFGWFYELTPEGFKRDEELAPDAPARQSNARKLDFAIIGVLVVIVVLLASGYFVHDTAPAGRTTAFDPPADSIVVLPFANLGDRANAYFSNGITEELTDALGQNTSLTVIAWNTASRYLGSNESPRQIGQSLNVAHVLAGSIQRAGGTVRVTAELVDTRNGRQLWSAHYDDSLQNIFAVQDKISAAIADALKVKFAGMQHAAPTLNPQAHEAYLKGLAALEGLTAADAQAAQQHFQQALQLDPKYADAWGALAASYMNLSQWSTLPVAEATTKSRIAARKALELDPDNVNALVQLGNADNVDNHIPEAISYYQRAIKLDPNNARAHLDYGTVLPITAALAQTREAARLDPDSATAQNNLATLYQDIGDWNGMVTAGHALNRLAPHSIDSAFGLAFAFTQMHRPEDAIRAFDLVHPTDTTGKQVVEAGRLSYQALRDSSLRPKALAALARLRGANASPFSQGDLLQLYLALGEKDIALKMLAPICAAGPVACNDLAINPMYAPLRGNPRFDALAKQYTTQTLN